jgi:hypothetical protein
MTADEVWATIAGHPGYLVSTDARVLSVARRCYAPHGGSRRVPPTILREFYKKGRPYVKLSHDGRGEHLDVKTTVAQAFLPPPPTSAHILDHLDGDRTNCAASNLRWTRRSGAA